MPTVDKTGPPDDLDADGRKLYRALRKILQESQAWQDSDMYVLGQVCRYEQRARTTRELIPHAPGGRPLLTTQGRSENSGEVAHPLVKIMETAEGRYLDGLKELGLTPAQRKRLAIEVGGGKGAGRFGRLG